jgi:hypothetical protein
MEKIVWLVWHLDDDAPDDVDENEKFIGVYSSEQLAREAVERLRDKPGFRDYPERWQVKDWALDEDHWKQGFARILRGTGND